MDLHYMRYKVLFAVSIVGCDAVWIGRWTPEFQFIWNNGIHLSNTFQKTTILKTHINLKITCYIMFASNSMNKDYTYLDNFQN
jgi:hypothetical protein